MMLERKHIIGEARMFCSNCGAENTNCNFCIKCGSSLVPVQETLGVSPIQKKQNGKIRWKSVGVCSIILALLFVIVYYIFIGRTPSITEEEVIQLINENEYNTYVLNQIVYSAEIQELVNFKSSWNRDSEKMTVAFDINMEDENVYVTKHFNAILKKRNEGWSIKRLDEEVTNISPKQGAVPHSNDELVDLVEAAYPEINWGYTFDGAFQPDINYDYDINIQFLSRETDLENKTDSLLYEYYFETNTLVIEGSFSEYYVFNDNDGWTYIYSDIGEVEANVRWQLEGMWSLDIYTYYVDVYIKDMLWDEQIAVIETRGSVYQGTGSVNTFYVPFSICEDGIYFTTFMLDKEITLIARYDDMYYLIPGMFSNQDSIEMATGGKSQ